MYNPKHTEYFQMLMVKKELESIREKLSSGLPNETAVRMNVIDPLLRALGWDTSDYKKVYPEFSTPNGRVDYALCSESSEPLCFIEAKPLGKIDGTKEQLFGYTEYFQVSIAILTDGQEWHFFYTSGEGTWEDKQVHTLDLSTPEIQENAEFFYRYLSYQAVRSGGAMNAMKNDYENSVIVRKMMAHADRLEDLRLENLSGDPDDWPEYVENVIGQRPTLGQIIHFIKKSHKAQSSSEPNPDKRLSVKMHDGRVVSENNFKDQNGVLFAVMKRLVDEFGGDTVMDLDKKGSHGTPFLIGDIPNFRGRSKPIPVKKYHGYYIAQTYQIDHKVEYLERLAGELKRELGIVLHIKAS